MVEKLCKGFAVQLPALLVRKLIQLQQICAKQELMRNLLHLYLHVIRSISFLIQRVSQTVKLIDAHFYLLFAAHSASRSFVHSLCQPEKAAASKILLLSSRL